MVYLGFLHTIRGDVAGRVVARLAALGARHVVYVGKVDARRTDRPHGPGSASGDRAVRRRTAHVCTNAVVVFGKRAVPRLVQVEPPRRLAPFPTERRVTVDDSGIRQAQRRRPVNAIRTRSSSITRLT